MFYQFNDEVTTIKATEIDEKIITAGYITLDELNKIYDVFGFSKATVNECKESPKTFKIANEIYDDYSFFAMKIPPFSDITEDEDCVAFYVKKNLFIVVDSFSKDTKIRDKFLQSLNKYPCLNVSLEKLICAFLDILVENDNSELQKIENEINRLEEIVLKDMADKNFNFNLLNMKKKLLLRRNYYDELSSLASAFEKNENELFDEKELNYFRNCYEKCKQLREDVDVLRDSIVHLRDTYSTYLDLKLNGTMKVFTVLSAIFFPLTVIVGWYGMNFDMPEFRWKFGYIFVIIFSVCVVGIFGLITRWRKWL